jgi:hypothetical protein
VVLITTNVVSSNPAQARCTRYNIVCQLLAAGLWFSPDTPVSSTNKSDRHDITEILLKVVLNTITLYLKCTPPLEFLEMTIFEWINSTAITQNI